MSKKKIWLKNVSEDYLRENIKSFRWEDICKYKTLSESFIREFANEIYWPTLCEYQKFSEDFLREMRDVIRDKGSEHGQLTNNHYDIKFIKEIVTGLDVLERKYILYNVCINQHLTEEFIERFKEEVDWGCVSKYQTFSDEFIKRHINELHLNELLNRGIELPKDIDE